MNQKQELDINISEQDLRLSDHELFLKIYENLQNKYEYLPTNNELNREITYAINSARPNRTLCFNCQGYAFVGLVNCKECRGRGYYE